MAYTRRDLIRATAALPSLAAATARAEAPLPQSFKRHLRDDNDLSLADWGPYTQRYVGTSHIADVRRGLRFDLSVLPGLYRRKVVVPNVRWESDYFPWEASADLDYYSFRLEIEWKDQVYCDVSYSRWNDHARLVRADCINRTPRNQNMVLHYVSCMNFPTPAGYEVELIPGAKWIPALDYKELTYATPRPTDSLVYDGLLRGEARDAQFTGGHGIGKDFGMGKGDRVDYEFALDEPMHNAALLVRARLPKGTTLETSLGTLRGTGEFTVTRLSASHLPAGRHTLSLVSEGGAPLDLDGFVLVNSPVADAIQFRPVKNDPVPEQIVRGPRPPSVLFKYKNLDTWYGVVWNFPTYQVRQFFCEELDRYFRDVVQNHVSLILRGPGEGHFNDIFLRPIPLAPNSNRVVNAMVCDGTREQVESMLREFPDDAACEKVYEAARAKRVVMAGRVEGRPYEFSQNRMAATNLTNVYFPLHVRKHYIRHNTPTPFAPMLYSWDAGFTGLGLLELDVERAVGCMNTYLTPPGDKQLAFNHHGTPLPVQIFVFLELWNRTHSRELLEFYYPRVRQYHMFLAGRLGSSTTRKLKSQLLQTWDYFYNTGWDDYPPQVHMHEQKIQKHMAAVTPTAHAIRTAKILAMAARELGLDDDVRVYENDIAVWSESLQRYSWDEQAGYFGYVRHDDAGNPTGILRHSSGANFNMGMCGAYPLFAGVCTPAQEKRLIGHLMTPGRMWTPIGMTTVDQSAPYFTPDGYWNGAVWMPHQWFFWKALLDLGRGDEAYRIASTGMDVWKRETDDSYLCLEHFMVQSGRGAGMHHFTGLSNPVMMWFNAYYRTGRLTAGYDAWILKHEFTDNNRRLEAEMKLTGPSERRSIVLVGMQPGTRYSATWAGRPAPARALPSGTLEVTLSNLPGVNKLVVEAATR